MFSLMESCKQNAVDPYYYLEDVLQRLPTHPNKHIHELLPHHWKSYQTLQLAAWYFTVSCTSDNRCLVARLKEIRARNIRIYVNGK